MINFMLGTIAGGIIACIATIAAARHPEVQTRLGLIPATTAAILAPVTPARAANLCPAPPKATPAVGGTDMLFARRRFWLVAP